jgi:hypothetical protein
MLVLDKQILSNSNNLTADGSPGILIDVHEFVPNLSFFNKHFETKRPEDHAELVGIQVPTTNQPVGTTTGTWYPHYYCYPTHWLYTVTIYRNTGRETTNHSTHY